MLDAFVLFGLRDDDSHQEGPDCHGHTDVHGQICESEAETQSQYKESLHGEFLADVIQQFGYGDQSDTYGTDHEYDDGEQHPDDAHNVHLAPRHERGDGGQDQNLGHVLDDHDEDDGLDLGMVDTVLLGQDDGDDRGGRTGDDGPQDDGLQHAETQDHSRDDSRGQHHRHDNHDDHHGEGTHLDGKAYEALQKWLVTKGGLKSVWRPSFPWDPYHKDTYANGGLDYGNIEFKYWPGTNDVFSSYNYGNNVIDHIFLDMFGYLMSN